MRDRSRSTFAAAAVFAVAIALLGAANWPASTSAATVSAKWAAPIKVGLRAQGSATLYAYSSGAGALGLRLSGLKPGGQYSVGLYAGGCSSLGTRKATLQTVTATLSGKVTRGLTLSRALTTRLRATLRSHLSVVIGSVRRCGTLARLSLLPSPTPTPVATPTPASMATPTPTPVLDPTPAPTPYIY